MLSPVLNERMQAGSDAKDGAVQVLSATALPCLASSWQRSGLNPAENFWR